MAPSGLIISKLGIQATASEQHVKGLLCLKISLPRENDGRPGARWALFGSAPPNLASPPSIYPLPLPMPVSRTPQLKLATKLLSLPTPTSYPPSPQSLLGGKPYIDVSSTTGKVYVVLDPVSANRRGVRSPSSSIASGSGSAAKEGRREWLVCMDFQVGLEEGVEEGISKVLLPLPKCLDNVIRFQIVSPSESLGEVNILTEPKMLPLTSSAFSSPPKTRRRSSISRPGVGGKGKMRAGVGEEEGWEDGEDLDPDDVSSEESDSEDSQSASSEEGGSWLEGRFQSTEVLRLEWSYDSLGSSSELPYLSISPQWDKYHPSISIAYTAEVSDFQHPLRLDVDVPDSWAWSELLIQGDRLRNWKSSEGDWGGSSFAAEADPDDTLDGTEVEDSFATIRAKRSRAASTSKSGSSPSLSSTPYLPARGLGPTHSGASLMRQTFPAPVDMKMEDYSFELSSIEQSPKRTTPARLRLRKSVNSNPSTPNTTLVNPTSSPVKSQLDEPRSGRQFDLFYDDLQDTQTGRTVVLQGTLVPLSNTLLVSPTIPVRIPFVSLSNHESTQCQIQCPSARYGAMSSLTSDVELVDIAQGGTFVWTDARGLPFARKDVSIKGDVRVRLRRSVWGVVSASLSFAFPRKTEETGFYLALPESEPYEGVRVIRSTVDGQWAPRATYVEEGKLHVRIGKQAGRDGGMVQVELEMLPSGSGEVVLPNFEGGDGALSVELVGDEWEPLIQAGIDTTLQATAAPPGSRLYTHPLSSTTVPSIRLALPTTHVPSKSFARTRARTLLSWSTLLNLFMLWLLVSMGQQVQRLRSEVAFVVDETRDLRMYGVAGVSERSGPRREDDSGAITEEIRFEHEATEGSKDEVGNNEPRISRDANSIDSAERTLTAPLASSPPPWTGEKQGEAPNTRDASIESGVVSAEYEHGTYPLSRVVRGMGRGWERWTGHPTVKTLTKGVAWIWDKVLWLVVS